MKFGGRSIEDLCQQLQMAPSKLNELTREYCGMSAAELVDGFKLSRLKTALLEKLRDAAHELWGERAHL